MRKFSFVGGVRRKFGIRNLVLGGSCENRGASLHERTKRYLTGQNVLEIFQIGAAFPSDNPCLSKICVNGTIRRLAKNAPSLLFSGRVQNFQSEVPFTIARASVSANP